MTVGLGKTRQYIGRVAQRDVLQAIAEHVVLAGDCRALYIEARGGLGGACLSVTHVQPHLVVGDVEAGQVVDPPRCRDESTAWPSPTRPPDGLETRLRRGRLSGRATPSLRSVPAGAFSS